MADKCFGVVSGGKLYRLTFSRSLADHVARAAGMEVRRVTFRVGRRLEAGQASASGLYAVCKAATGWPLRVTLFRELADLWRDGSVTVHEAWVAKTEAV